MEGSLLDPLPNTLVTDEIFTRLPWHTRPRLLTTNKTWKRELESMDEQSGRLTRCKLPLQCRVAVDYLYYRQRGTPRYSYGIQIFDEEWKNAPPNGSEWRLSMTQRVIGVIDGSLYSVKNTNEENTISVLDVAGGLWQWRTVYSQGSNDGFIMSICRRLGAAGGIFVYRTFPLEKVNQILHVNGQGLVEQVTEVLAPNNDPDFRMEPCMGFQQIQDRLYVFGIRANRRGYEGIGIRYYDLNLDIWNNEELYSLEKWFNEFGRNPNDLSVMENVLCLAYIHPDLYILRYSSSTRRWVMVGSMLARVLEDTLSWSWSVEWDRRGEKQLYLYSCDKEHGSERFRVPRRKDGDEDIRVNKWLVRGKAVEGRLGDRKVWDDNVLPQLQAECELVREMFPGRFLRARGKLERGHCFGFIRKK